MKHRTPGTQCRRCQHRLDSATNFRDPKGPAAGDVSVCIGCGCISIFNADGTLRVPTAAEFKKFEVHPDVVKMVNAVELLHRHEREKLRWK